MINHPLYQLMQNGYGAQMPQAQQPMQQTMPMVSGIPQFQNPMQKMNYIMQAMRNPAAFVRQHLNIPDQIANDPNAILQYMQSNMGVTQADIQNAAAQIPAGVR